MGRTIEDAAAEVKRYCHDAAGFEAEAVCDEEQGTITVMPADPADGQSLRSLFSGRKGLHFGEPYSVCIPFTVRGESERWL